MKSIQVPDLSGGELFAAGCGSHGCNHGGGSYRSGYIAEADQTTNPTVMTEEQLKGQLNAQGKQMYDKLSPEGKPKRLN